MKKLALMLLAITLLVPSFASAQSWSQRDNWAERMREEFRRDEMRRNEERRRDEIRREEARRHDEERRRAEENEARWGRGPRAGRTGNPLIDDPSLNPWAPGGAFSPR